MDINNNYLNKVRKVYEKFKQTQGEEFASVFLRNTLSTLKQNTTYRMVPLRIELSETPVDLAEYFTIYFFSYEVPPDKIEIKHEGNMFTVKSAGRTGRLIKGPGEDWKMEHLYYFTPPVFKSKAPSGKIEIFFTLGDHLRRYLNEEDYKIT